VNAWGVRVDVPHHTLHLDFWPPLWPSRWGHSRWVRVQLSERFFLRGINPWNATNMNKVTEEDTGLKSWIRGKQRGVKGIMKRKRETKRGEVKDKLYPNSSFIFKKLSNDICHLCCSFSNFPIKYLIGFSILSALVNPHRWSSWTSPILWICDILLTSQKVCFTELLVLLKNNSPFSPCLDFYKP